MVIRAIYQNGSLHPLDPLPISLAEGQQIEISFYDDQASTTPEAVEAWYADIRRMGQPGCDDGGWKQFDAAIAEHRQWDKEDVGRRMGLP